MNDSILARYEQARELIHGVLTNKIVMNDAVLPHWINGSACFWYLRETKDGIEFRIVDADNASNTPAFNHKQLASALTESTGKPVNDKNLPLKNVVISLSPLKICFDAFGKNWQYENEEAECREVDIEGPDILYSSDNLYAAFLRENNLWIRNRKSGIEKALTQDGHEDCCYSTVPNRTTFSASTIQALWSQDSKRLLTFQLDTRHVSLRPSIQYLPQDGSSHPVYTQSKLAYPGDAHIESYRLVSIDIHTGEQVEADYDPLPVWGTGQGFFNDDKFGWWSSDNRRAYFIDVKRGANTVRVVEFDTHTGNTKTLIEESSETFVKLSHTALEHPLILPLPETNELIWFSERSGWAHLYLYDLNTGSLKQPITEGQWLVRNILHYDSSRRELLIQTAGRDSNINPYYRDICRVNIDSQLLTQLISGNYEHIVYNPENFNSKVRMIAGLCSGCVDGVSQDGNYIVTTYSRVDTPPISVLIDRNGKEILQLETADISGLPKDWIWPEPVQLKSANGNEDIYGVVYRPPGFSPDKLYPVLDFSCGMRSQMYVPQGSFFNGPCYDMPYFAGAALAALGFVVVAMEGRGTPHRSKAFQDHNYGDIASASDLNDRVAGLHQLGERFPYMDLDRVGLTGLDNIASSVYGLINHSDFYSVAVLHCFTEPEFWFASIAEQYDGVSLNTNSTPSLRYDKDRIASFNGKLLLIQGMLDFATPSSTFQLVEALQNANKDFDMICLPNGHHDVPPYALRRNWDYLVKHLQGIEPPKDFLLTLGIGAFENDT